MTRVKPPQGAANASRNDGWPGAQRLLEASSARSLRSELDTRQPTMLRGTHR